MPKVRYNDITFDSELEIEYYKHLKEQSLAFIYHPKTPIKLNFKNTYTPDFIVFYDDRIEIVETKGFNQYSYRNDNTIHNLMLSKTKDELLEFLYANGVSKESTIGQDVIYKKIKFMKTFGWVDFDFKNPNTIANQRKNKILELELELKELREFKKNVQRYFTYCNKLSRKIKLTKSQLEWLSNFENKYIYEREEN